MTKKELLEKLQEMPDDAKVYLMADYWQPACNVLYDAEHNEIVIEA